MNQSLSIRMKVLIVATVVLISMIKDTTAIMCYHCNSAYDPRCGDPFDSFSLGQVNCSVTPKPDHITELPTLCRKIKQKVYGEQRIVRGCGYITDLRDDKDCLKRSGTHDVHALYCACTTDFCNASHRSFNQHSTIYAIMLLPLVYLINQRFQRQL
ncbi:unnamed protein product [Diamesa serratosioi]